MKKLLFSFLILCLSFFLFADWKSISRNSGKDLFCCESDNLNETEISFNLDGYLEEEIQRNGEIYQQITYPQEGEILEIGKPDLPCFSRIIAIPDDGIPEFRILSSSEQIVENISVFPQQELQSESSENRKNFVIDNNFYEGNQCFPNKIVELGEPAILRDFRIVRVTVFPFQYDPRKNELEIVTNLIINISTAGSSDLSQQKISRAFEPTYKANILNYSMLQNREDIFQDPSYLFIYSDDDDVKENLNYLMEWKKQIGFEVAVAGFPSTVMANEIKDYIQDAYDNWENPPEFICIAGDAVGSYSIPASDGYGDHSYTTLAGNDVLSDVFIGRLSFSTITELQTIVYKIFNYEKTPYMDDLNWYHSALMVGDPSSSGTSTVDTKRYVADMIMEYDEHFHLHEVYSGGFSSQITNNINIGVSFFNYRGYWGMSGYTVNSINQLNNGYLMPVVIALTCDTGSFTSGTSRSEAFLRAGSPGQPKGGIAAIGTATISTHTCFNNCVDSGINYGIFVEHTFHMGGALNRGKLNLYLNYANVPSAVSNFSSWNNLMGDPGMAVWTDVPKELVVNYQENISIGANNLLVNVTDLDGTPLENAWVTFLSNESDLNMDTGYTDANGNIVLEMDTSSEYTASLTVTKHNFIPHLGSCEISSNDYSISVSDFIVDDDNNGTSIGNGDGIINPGESIELQVELHNYGVNDLSDVSATIYSLNNFINITDDTENYGIMPAGGSGFCPDDFDFTVTPNVMEGNEIILQVVIEDGASNVWNDNIVIPISGAYLSENGYGFPNNPNALLEPGETSEFVIMIENTGSDQVDDIYGIISCSDYLLSIGDDEAYFGNIPATSQITNNNDTFEITVAPTAINGCSIDMEIYLYNSAGFETTLFFPIQVGTASINDPLGPDSYGYYCLDDGDIDYNDCPEYEWLEINEIGTLINLFDPGNTGSVEVVDLPFTLTFYGEDYDEITVCSNGWISPGITEDTSFMNWLIPGAMGPNPMIAPFWDDLKCMSNNIFYYYDEDRHCFIVEWDDVLNEYNDDAETFQVIIYENDVSPEFINNQIKFQYKEINNVDQGYYPSQHGQFASVGIEDHTSTRGLEYTFNDEYAVSNKVLQDEMAILFSGGPMQIYNDPEIVIDDFMIIDLNGNGQADFGEEIELQVVLRNLGIPDVTDVTAELTSTDPYLTITEANVSYNTIPGNNFSFGIDNFELEISDDCPNGYFADLLLQVLSNEGSWDLEFSLELHAPVIEFYSFFVDDGENNILDPGETAQLQVAFINNGGVQINDLTTIFSVNDPLITINNTTSQINNIAVGNLQVFIIDIDVSPSAVLYHEFDLNWQMTGENNYFVEGDIPIVLGQQQVEILEEFSLNFPPAGWTVEGDNWFVYNTNEAGGEPPEAAFHFYPLFTGEQRLITMPIDTSGLSSLNLDYKYFLRNWTGTGTEYVVSVETTANGTDWHTIWECWPNSNMGPLTNNIIINNSDLGSENFQIAFHFSGTTSGIRYWRIDDVHIRSSFNQMFGYLEGNLSLNGGNGNVADAVIFTGNHFTNPDADGNFCLALPIGSYEVSCELEEYGIYNEQITITAGQSTQCDISLEYLEAPINLTGSLIDNDIVLNWEMPDGETEDCKTRMNSARKKENRDNSRSLTGYRIYRNGLDYYNIFNPDIHTYTDCNPVPSIYVYYVTAIYDNIFESVATNEVTINMIVDNDEIVESFENYLGNNYPNPFNPTTKISFSTTDNNELTEITVYNLRGQKVKQLVREQFSAGRHSVFWNGKNDAGKSVSSGIYFYEMKNGDYRKTRKMLLLQ